MKRIDENANSSKNEMLNIGDEIGKNSKRVQNLTVPVWHSQHRMDQKMPKTLSMNGLNAAIKKDPLYIQGESFLNWPLNSTCGKSC